MRAEKRTLLCVQAEVNAYLMWFKSWKGVATEAEELHIAKLLSDAKKREAELSALLAGNFGNV